MKLKQGLNDEYKISKNLVSMLQRKSGRILKLDDSSVFCNLCGNLSTNVTISRLPISGLPDKFVCPACSRSARFHEAHPYDNAPQRQIRNANMRNHKPKDIAYIGPERYPVYASVAKSIKNHQIRAIHLTILYKNVLIKYNKTTQTYTKESWDDRWRLSFNFEKKQVFAIDKNDKVFYIMIPANNGLCWLTSESYADEPDSCGMFDMFALQPIINKYIMPEILGRANLQSYVSSFRVRGFINVYTALLFLRYPIFAKKIYDETKARHTTSASNTFILNELQRQLSIVIWCCQYDRTINHIMTSSSESEYETQVSDMVLRTYGSSRLYDEVKDYPLGVCYLWYLYQLGWRNADCVLRMIQASRNTNKVSEGALTVGRALLYKRSHSRKHFYRNSLREKGETAFTTELISILDYDFEWFFPHYSKLYKSGFDFSLYKQHTGVSFYAESLDHWKEHIERAEFIANTIQSSDDID